MKRKIWVMIPILWCGIIFYFTQSPLFTSASTDGKIAAFFGISDGQVVNALNYLSRKSAHFLLFALLAVFIKSMLNEAKRSYWLAWIGASAYGVTDELHQVFVEGRGPSILDAGIDSAGAGVALLIYYAAARKLRNWKSKEGRRIEYGETGEKPRKRGHSHL
ncbi:VanZ family protein [Cohnella thailandensis]|uniref:VanZ family protein n=1 Tax=Cohnella thailandensis TaxID=557557 RepID=A0A841ST49_9BACL|nr:VanZ family protein [Cohnella thailandensis]MBB6635114.1 VanZ family protein [Cohnella thailandensis]MBP1974420.1 VanZ family protein [Cohnella thailandensis]